MRELPLYQIQLLLALKKLFDCGWLSLKIPLALQQPPREVVYVQLFAGVQYPLEVTQVVLEWFVKLEMHHTIHVVVWPLMGECSWLAPILLLALELSPSFLLASTDTKYPPRGEGQDGVEVASVVQ